MGVLTDKLMVNFIAHRSVYACQKAAKRKFSSYNYKGKWTQEDEIRLVELVKLMNRRWTQIAEELNRTPENCRDKFRELGGCRPENRKKGKWDLEEKLELIKCVNQNVDNPFCIRKVICDYNNPESIVFEKDLSDKQQKLLEKGYKKTQHSLYLYREFDLGDIVDMIISDPDDVPRNDLPWGLISKDMVSRPFLL